MFYEYMGRSFEVFEENQLVAVYGTLKRGLSNHGLLADAEFIGSGETLEKYRLCISSLPFLLDGVSEDGYNVDVEVYRVTPREMIQLDLLEGHPSFYKRKQTTVVVDGKEMVAWTYFVPALNYDSRTYFKSYDGYKVSYAEAIEQAIANAYGDDDYAVESDNDNELIFWVSNTNPAHCEDTILAYALTEKPKIAWVNDSDLADEALSYYGYPDTILIDPAFDRVIAEGIYDDVSDWGVYNFGSKFVSKPWKMIVSHMYPQA